MNLHRNSEQEVHQIKPRGSPLLLFLIPRKETDERRINDWTKHIEKSCKDRQFDISLTIIVLMIELKVLLSTVLQLPTVLHLPLIMGYNILQNKELHIDCPRDKYTRTLKHIRPHLHAYIPNSLNRQPTEGFTPF